MQYQENSYPTETIVSDFMYRVYGWMSLALALTAGIAYYIFQTKTLFFYLRQHPWAMVGLIIGQFVIVLALAFFVMRISFTTALILFVLYAGSVGVTMASIFFVYTSSSIYATFAVTSGMFAVMSLYGFFTKSDLTTIGNYAIMGLIGIIIGMLVNMFLRNAMFDYVLSAIGVLIFVLLIAYDTQKLKRLAAQMVVDAETRGKVAIIGALTLYLDFINLFLFLLRFMGNRRKN